MTTTPAANGEEIARAILSQHDLDWETFDGRAAEGYDADLWTAPMKDLATEIASAIATARQQAGEEAAKIADDWRGSEAFRRTAQVYPGDITANNLSLVRNEATEIAHAIRSHFKALKGGK